VEYVHEQEITTIWDILESNLPPEEDQPKTEKELKEESDFLRKANLRLQQEIREGN